MIIYQGGADPTLPQYSFTFPDGVTETLSFNKSEWRYYWHQPTGLIPLDGVTGVTKICTPANILMRWAVKVALLRTKQLLIDGGFVGDVMPNVLFESVLDEILAKAKKEDENQLEEAGAVGTAAHDWIEHVIKARDNEERRHELFAKFPLDERSANCCIASVDWMVRHNVKWIFTERKIFSRKHGVAGTCDGAALVSSCDDPSCCPHKFVDRKSIIDWKSSNSLRVSYLFQVAIYRAGYIEETGDQIEDMWILRLDKETGAFDPWHVEGEELYQEYLQGFLNCLETCRSIAKAEDRVGGVVEERRMKRRAAEEKIKMFEQKLKCKNSDTYKGSRIPTCNHGDPCVACVQKYNERHAEKPLTVPSVPDTVKTVEKL